MNSNLKYVNFKILLTFILIFFITGVKAQEVKGFFKQTRPVKIWVLTHPFAASKSKKIALNAVERSRFYKNDNRLDGLENGGQIDAFRHTYWMALMSRQFNCRKAFRLGKAYERGNYLDFKKNRTEEGYPPDSVSVAMDLFNNCQGVFVGFENQFASDVELEEIVIQKILNGELLIISRDKEGRFLDCDGNVIPDEEWMGKWINKRCLVPSNRIR